MVCISIVSHTFLVCVDVCLILIRITVEVVVKYSKYLLVGTSFNSLSVLFLDAQRVEIYIQKTHMFDAV